MSNYRKTKRDANHVEICNYLRDNRVWVYDGASAGVLTDLIVFKFELVFLEIKIEGSRAQYTFTQLNFIAETPAPVAIVKTKEAALEFALYPRTFCLRQSQKNKLAVFLAFNKKKFYQPSEIEGVLGV